MPKIFIQDFKICYSFVGRTFRPILQSHLKINNTSKLIYFSFYFKLSTQSCTANILMDSNFGEDVQDKCKKNHNYSYYTNFFPDKFRDHFHIMIAQISISVELQIIIQLSKALINPNFT